MLLGVTGEVHFESRVELPKGYSPEIPGNLDLKEDFAEYHASYSVKDGTLIALRRCVVKLTEVPISEYETYKKFSKAVSDDHDLYIALSSGNSPADPLESAMSRLPQSDIPEAARAYDDAVAAAQSNNVPGAIDSLKHALTVDPHFTRARMWLSRLYAFKGLYNLALDELRTAYDKDPQTSVTYKALVVGLVKMKKLEEAVAVLQTVVKTNPEEADAFSYLGAELFALKRYSEAADADESAVKLRPDRPGLYVQLGSAYLHAGNEDKPLQPSRRQSKSTRNRCGSTILPTNWPMPTSNCHWRSNTPRELFARRSRPLRR